MLTERKPGSKRHISYEISRIGKSVEKKTDWRLPGAIREERMRRDCRMGVGFDFGVMKTFGNLIKVVAVQHVKVLNATELFPLTWLVLCEFHLD